MCRVTPFSQLHNNVASCATWPSYELPSITGFTLVCVTCIVRSVFFMCLCVLNVTGHRKIKDPELSALNSKKCVHLRYLPCAVWWDETVP